MSIALSIPQRATRTARVPLHADDVSTFATALGRQLSTAYANRSRPPGHVELLNMLARALGHRNFQSLKAAASPARPAIQAPALDDATTRALRHYDPLGRVASWPVRRSVQRALMWGLWMRFDAARRYSEREVNEVLNAWHVYGDHCTLRRELIEMKLLTRKDGGAEYRKVPARADAPVIAMLRELRARSAATATPRASAGGSTPVRRSTR